MRTKIILILFLVCSFSLSQLKLPDNGSLLRKTHIMFSWEQEPEAIYYNLQVSNDSEDLLDINESTTVYIDTQTFQWNSTYYWRVRPVYDGGIFGTWTDVHTFSIGDSQLTNLDVEIFDENLIEDGYLVYSQFLPYFVVGAIDKYGNEIWNNQSIYMNHISEQGVLYGNIPNGVRYNFDQDILWQTVDDNIDGHEVKQIPNGNYMAFSPTYQLGPIPYGEWTDYFQTIGYIADGEAVEFPWVGMRLVEYDKITGEEVWSWEPFEHFTTDDCDLYQGFWWQAAFNGSFDWMHSNAFHFDEEESVIYVSHRHLSRISKISYPSGEVIWNMGLPEQFNTGSDNICTELLFSFQHHIQLMEDGTLLFFDNGNISHIVSDDEFPTSRLRRIRVIDDAYCETVWQYDLPPNLHGAGMGSVQLLDNGNYSVYTYGNGLSESECSIFEITENGELLWKVTSQNPNAAWYRSYKVPSIHPEAFSLIADNFLLQEDGSEVIYLDGNNLSFTLFNKSDYAQMYNYRLEDLNESNSNIFENIEGQYLIMPNDSLDLSFIADFEASSQADIKLIVWPSEHEYSKEEYLFNVVLDNNLIGDINNDQLINVIDVVLLVNYVLNNNYSIESDLNNDSSLNVLDIVILVNLIVG